MIKLNIPKGKGKIFKNKTTGILVEVIKYDLS
jgi:hypothetical protein